MTTSVPNFNFLPALVSEIMVGSQNKKKLRAANLPKRPLADKFLYRTIVLVNAHEFSKFLLPNWINFGDTERVLVKIGSTA